MIRILFLIGLSTTVTATTTLWAQQIMGQNPAAVNTQNVYTYINSMIVFPTWQVNGNGQILSYTQNGSTYQATIQWNTAGSGVVTFKDGSTTKATLTVTITATPVAPIVTSGERCGPGTVTLSAIPQQGGNAIKWYDDENTSSGTIGMTFTTPTITITKKYYATTYNTATGAESQPRTPVWATVKTLPPSPTILNDKRIGPGTLDLASVGGGACQWFSAQGVLLNTSPNYMTPVINSSTANYMYAKTFGSNGCASAGQTWINVVVDPKPKPVVSSNRIVMGTTVSLDAGGGYASYTWTNADGVIVSTASVYQTNIAGEYSVTTTKTGYYGTGSSDPVKVYSQLENQPVNFVVVNKLQFITTDASRMERLSVDSLSQKIQYFDGLGRTIQTVETQASPAKTDVIVPNAFDAFGREVKTFLPYTDGNDGRYKTDALATNNDANEVTRYRSGKQFSFYQNNPTIAQDLYPYAEKIPEPGGLNRPLQQGAAGQIWQPNPASTYVSPASSGKSLLFSYEFNAANEVLLWRPVASSISAFGLINAGSASAPIYYPANKLYKNRTKDENRNEVITYTDTDGKVILKRVQILSGTNLPVNDTNFASTYYVYDPLGQLVCVLPPEAVKNISTQYYHAAATDVTKNNFLNLWAFRYQYDDRFRMVQKKMPGAKPVYMVYDVRNRVVLTQDGNQRSNPAREWSFVKYDAFNRPVATGIYSSVDSLAILQGKLDVDGNPKFENYNGGTSYFGYTNQSFPTTVLATLYLTVTYYDKYDANIAPAGYTYLNESLPGQETAAFSNAVGQITGKLNRIVGTASMLRTVNYYDRKKRNVQSIGQHHRSGTLRTTTVYDFVGKVMLNFKTYLIDGATTKVKETIKYDHAGRIVSRMHSVNGSSQVVLARHDYNSIGQLIDKRLHSDDGTVFKQSVDYRYNIRGWLTKINEAEISAIASGDPTYDFFGMELTYTNGIAGLSSTNVYNGNISTMQWSKGNTAGSTTQAYAFTYDPASRLLNATHNDKELDLTTGVRAWKSNSNQLSEVLTYDYNGNIKTLTRKGANGSAIDNLTYGYSGNMLSFVNDAGDAAMGFVNGNAGSDDYSYDFNGNLDKDKNKGLSNKGNIKYNFLNLPVEITKGAEKVKYIYDATGLKLSQEVYNSSGVLSKVTDYVGEMILEGTTSATTVKMIRHPEGRVLTDGSSWEYQYHLSDHLGNIRLTFSAKPQATTTYVANFEATTNNAFLNYSRHTFDLVDHTDAATTFQNTQRLTGAGRVGLAKTFVVMPGDKITASAYVKYMNLSSTMNTASFINSLASAFGVSSTSTGESAKIFTSLNGYAGMVSGGHFNDDDSGSPKAFITILFFDKNYKLLDAAWDQVSSMGTQTSATIKQPHDLVTISATAPDGGYAYVFLSNEHPTNVEVFFDDVSMSVTPSAIVGVDDYYPFGLTYNSSERTNTFGQDFKFQGQEHIDDLGLHWDSFKWRNHDPAIGRFFCVDPLAEKYVHNSPYAFSENHVTVHVELEGLEKVYVFDQAQRPPDNGVAGTSYTAEVYVVNEQNGSVNGPYEGSSYPNSISSSNNATSYNTLKTGEHLFNNESGHLGSSKQGLNIVNANGERKASGTDPSGNDVTMTLVNFHVGTSDNGGPQSRGSAGCLTISPADGNGFMSNFDWSGSKTVVNSQGQQVTYSGTTGVSTGSITVHRGDTQASKLDKLKIELLNVTINSLNEKADNGSKQN